MFSGRALVATTLLCCLLVVGAPLTVAAQPTPAAPASTDSEPAEFDRCFPADGYEFTIGTYGPEITMVIHLSLLTNLGGPGALGVELAGSTGHQEIIELRTGVIFNGIDDVGSFLSNPFAAFSIAFEYHFQLPMFGEDFAFEDDDAPINGPVGNASC